MPASIIKADNLTKDYGKGRGIFDLSFEVEKGQCFGFLGSNGAGKTTTIRHLLGFSRPQKGSALVSGLDSWAQAAMIQKNVGYLPGDIAFPEGLTGVQLFRMLADLRGMEDLGKADYLIHKFQLDPTGQVKKMSKGMKQKTGIVAAFMHDPGILILDEPTTGLDPLMQATFIQLMMEEKAAGKTILLSSHMFEEVESTCDRIALIKQGRILTTINPADIRHANTKTFKIEFTTAEDCLRMSQETLNFIDVNLPKKQVQFRIDDVNLGSLFKLLSGYEMKFMSEVKFTLGDYFMHYYSKHDGGKMN